MSFEELPYFMTPKQLADVTGEHEGSITRGIREGRIPADKVNGRWRICRDVIFKNAKKGASNVQRFLFFAARAAGQHFMLVFDYSPFSASVCIHCRYRKG